MKRNTRLMIIVLVTVLWLVAQPLAAEAKTNDRTLPFSCINPLRGEKWKCAALERQILASTVRLEWRVSTRKDDGSGYDSVGSIGHATIVAGRYLVTHNHTSIVSLSNPKDGERVVISVYTANGKLIWEGSLVAITIVVENAETLVLDFGIYRGAEMFTTLGMASAELAAWESLPLQPGMEVAQIDWNGATTHVDWVTIENVITDSGVPRLELANFVMQGASGGGIFWNGYHIANNWYRETMNDVNSGTVMRQYSVTALNSTQTATVVDLAPTANESVDSADSRGAVMD